MYIIHFSIWNGLNVSIKQGEGKIEDMARKKRAARRARSTVVRKKNASKAESKRTQSRALIAILALLLFLHLIDEKMFDSVTSTVKPSKKHAKKRHGRTQRRVVHKKHTHVSRKSRYAKPRRR